MKTLKIALLVAMSSMSVLADTDTESVAQQEADYTPEDFGFEINEPSAEDDFEDYGFDISEPSAAFSDDGEPVLMTRDPLEPFNRAMFGFNDVADRYILLPIVKGYKLVTPDPLERGVDNFFSNLSEIGSALNASLQFKLKDAGVYSARFVTNTTIGLLGFWDPASSIGLNRLEGEDFGQTLGYYGVPSGPYLMLPFFGPSNLRDGTSRFVDSFYDYKNVVDNVPLRNSMTGVDLLNLRAQVIEAEAFITGDRYTFIREAYIQRREYLVRDGDMGNDDDFDDFGQDYDEDWDEY